MPGKKRKKSKRKGGPRATTAGPTAKVTRRGQYFTVRPVVPGLAAAFGMDCLELDPGTAAIRLGRAPLLLPHPDAPGGGYLEGLAGLEAAAAEWLEENGWSVEMRGRRPEEWPAADASVLEEFEPADAGFLEMVRTCDRGLVRYDPAGVDVCRLVAQAARAWPKKAKIVVVAERRGDVRRLAAGLEALGIAAVALDATGVPSRVSGVVVATPATLGQGCVGIERRTLMFHLDPQRAWEGFNGLQALQAAWRARAFGFLPEGRVLSPQSNALMHALYGHRCMSIPAHGERPRRVVTAWVDVRGGPPPTLCDDTLVWKRASVWRHPVRNRRLAALARAVADASPDDAVKCLPELASSAPKSGRHRVVVVVENLEHAGLLAGRLPGFEVVSHVGGEDPPDAKGQFRIVTMSALPAVRRANVLIRADGGKGGLSLAGDILRESIETPRQPLILVDCRDAHHPALRQRSRHREAAYRDLGWLGPQGDTDGIPEWFLRVVGGDPR